MRIEIITKWIDELLAKDLEEKGYLKKYYEGDDGRYEWHFEKKDQDIRLMEIFKENLNVSFSLFHTTILLGKEIYEFIPNYDLYNIGYGYKFESEEELKEVLLFFKKVIIEDGIPWMEENYKKYKRTSKTF